MVERNGSMVLDDENLAYVKDQLKTTDISKYCTLENNVLTIHDHEGYTDELNKYWHHRLNINKLSAYFLGVSDEIH